MTRWDQGTSQISTQGFAAAVCAHFRTSGGESGRGNSSSPLSRVDVQIQMLQFVMVHLSLICQLFLSTYSDTPPPRRHGDSSMRKPASQNDEKTENELEDDYDYLL